MFAYTSPNEGLEGLRGRIGIAFEARDRWFEEDEELLGHPRDPFTRIDVRQSSLHIEVLLEGTKVIDSTSPFSSPRRALDPLLCPVARRGLGAFRGKRHRIHLSLQGAARYWSAAVAGSRHEDVIWHYPEPLQDAIRIRDTVGLYHERLDVLVDGEKVEEWPTYSTK